MLKSDLTTWMGAPRVVFEQDSGASGGGATVLTGALSDGNGDGSTDGDQGGDGGSGNNGDNGGVQSFSDWRDQLPDDLKANEIIKTMDGKTIGDVTRNFIELRGQSDKFTPPAEDATDAEKSAWWKDRSKDAGYVIPDDVKGYEIGKPEIPDGMIYDEARLDRYLQKFLELGIPKHIVTELVKLDDDAAIAQYNQDIQDSKKYRQELADTMKAEYKDDYKKVAEMSARTLKAYAKPETLAFLDNTTIDGKRLGDMPEMVDLIYNISQDLSEDQIGNWNNGKRGSEPKNVDKHGNPILDFPSMRKDG